jgi:hypothetical protein
LERRKEIWIGENMDWREKEYELERMRGKGIGENKGNGS